MLPSLAGLTLRTDMDWDDMEYAGWHQGPTRGVTNLMEASEAGQADVVQNLLDQGARVNDVDTRADTALSYASREGHVVVVKLLLDRGARIDNEDRSGQTPLMFASRHGHVDVVRLLLSRGAEVDKTGDDGWTALIIASLNGRVNIVELLLGHGADPDKKDTSNRKMARGARSQEVQDLLKDAKAIRARYRAPHLLKRWRAWFHARAFWRYWYFRAVGRVYAPGGPGYEESMSQLKKLFRDMGYTSTSFSDFLIARMRGSAR